MELVRAYIGQAPEAISGNGGHWTTLRVARTLFNGFGLSRGQVLECLRLYNARLSEKWSERELKHKTDSAVSMKYDKPRGWMLNRRKPSAPKRVTISAPEFTRHGQKIAKQYTRATDATDIFHTSPHA